MKKIYSLFLLPLSIAAMAQDKPTTPVNYPSTFNEIRTVTRQHRQLWNKDLYTAILLVDPQTRAVVANEADSAGILKKRPDGVFAGQLPNNVNIANTSVNWSGKRWAMILLPLPEDKYERLNLMSHEMFHRAQPALGFIQPDPDNPHMNKKEGRLYLRLELEALKKAIQAASAAEVQQHVTSALLFREYRRQLYPGADTTENQLELNEGLAEFTGAMTCGRNEQQNIAHFTSSIEHYVSYPTFVRSFAYQTIPAYGYLLSKQQPYWNHHIDNHTDLTAYFLKAFNVTVPADLKTATDKLSGSYNGSQILAEETDREIATQKLVAAYKKTFVESPHTAIALKKMNISFNPSIIVPLEDKGTVYPTMRVTDLWGILTVTKGALMNPSWNMITLSAPTDITNKKASGDGWTLELNDGYTLVKDEQGNYKLTGK
ncbi:hypothetical protein [Chitinophaga vietnamensis]|uniref:hypothetical protein n=1 Tax=Chitinophaga vietnamensis TaxID=2593957 RepID=UPI001177D00A|nr:hypothetical protein [Chitinophaga vietnamensis]